MSSVTTAGKLLHDREALCPLCWSSSRVLKEVLPVPCTPYCFSILFPHSLSRLHLKRNEDELYLLTVWCSVGCHCAEIKTKFVGVFDTHVLVTNLNIRVVCNFNMASHTPCFQLSHFRRHLLWLAPARWSMCLNWSTVFCESFCAFAADWIPVQAEIVTSEATILTL